MQLDTQTYRKDIKYPAPDPVTRFYRGYGAKGRAKRNGQIVSILIHTTNNPKKNVQLPIEARFLLDSPDVSANYIVSSQDRAVVQLLPDDVIAWHSGDCADNDYENERSIGIEIVWAPGLGSLPQLATDNVTILVQLLLEKYPTITKIDMHRAQAIPAGRKIDPSGWSNEDFYAWRDKMLFRGAVNEITATSTILALPRCTEEQAVDYLLRRDTGEYNSEEITRFVQLYFKSCISVGVDPCITIAQMIHETGNLTSFWASRPQRNPAGIGVTGRKSVLAPLNDNEYPEMWAYDKEDKLWKYGVSFPMWDYAIPAHVGRLLAYTKKDNELITDEEKKIVAFALSYRPLPDTLRGTVTTLRGLGGTWAFPGTTYGTSLAKIANAISNV